MAKIVIYTLSSNFRKTFIYNLTTEEAKTIFAGAYSYGSDIMNTTDRTYINATDTGVRFDGGGINSINYHDNNVNTRTSSRSIYN
ncbi:MAG: hypothetical protein RM338_18110 [Nostoc sp. DedQUE12a]|nr:hypothetical protein [Nostoc sp. DedQUE12a]